MQGRRAWLYGLSSSCGWSRLHARVGLSAVRGEGRSDRRAFGASLKLGGLCEVALSQRLELPRAWKRRICRNWPGPAEHSQAPAIPIAHVDQPRARILEGL